MKNRLRHAIVIAALTAIAAAPAPDWRFAASSGDKPNRTIYVIDVASITRSGDNVDFRTQSIFESMTESRDFDRSVTKRHGNCTTMSSQIVENSYYARGEFLDTDQTSSDPIAHKDGSIMYDVLAQACGKEPFQKDTVANPEFAARNYFAQ